MNLPEGMKVTESPILYFEGKPVGKIEDWNVNPLGSQEAIFNEDFVSTRNDWKCTATITDTEVYSDILKAFNKTAYEISFTLSLSAKALCKSVRAMGKVIKKIPRYRNMMKYYRMMEQRKPKKVRR